MTQYEVIDSRKWLASRGDLSVVERKLTEMRMEFDDPKDEDRQILGLLLRSVRLMMEIWDYNESHNSMDVNTRVMYTVKLRHVYNDVTEYIYRYDDNAYLLAYSIRDALKIWIKCI